MNLSILIMLLFCFSNLFSLTESMFPGRRQGYGFNGEGAVPPQNNQRARQAAVFPRGQRPYAYDPEPSAAEIANFHRFQNVDQIGQNLPLINHNLHNNAVGRNVQHEEITEDSYPPQISDDESEVSTSGTTISGYGRRENESSSGSRGGGSSRDIYGVGSVYGIPEEGSANRVHGGGLVHGTPGEGSGRDIYGGESKPSRNTHRKN
uniref:Uncharacterized protein n=1 Tax=Meloidogyne enterolobii TaxID=390850 RepID=A0A6V7U2C0_MELEN|nr:unnamed protein product [Meloidogyne enterolobii]